MERHHGRKGLWNEFIEYKPMKGLTLIAQKSGINGWYVYRNQRGAIKTLKHFCGFNSASAYAHKVALKEVA